MKINNYIKILIIVLSLSFISCKTYQLKYQVSCIPCNLWWYNIGWSGYYGCWDVCGCSIWFGCYCTFWFHCNVWHIIRCSLIINITTNFIYMRGIIISRSSWYVNFTPLWHICIKLIRYRGHYRKTGFYMHLHRNFEKLMPWNWCSCFICDSSRQNVWKSCFN